MDSDHMALRPFGGEEVRSGDMKREASVEENEVVAKAIEIFHGIDPKRHLELNMWGYKRLGLPVFSPAQINRIFSGMVDGGKWHGIHVGFLNCMLYESRTFGYEEFVLDNPGVDAAGIFNGLTGDHSGHMRIRYDGELGSHFALCSSAITYDLDAFEGHECAFKTERCTFNIARDMRWVPRWNATGNIYNVRGDCEPIGKPSGKKMLGCSFNVGGEIGRLTTYDLESCVIRTDDPAEYERVVACGWVPGKIEYSRFSEGSDKLREMQIMYRDNIINRVVLVKDIDEYFPGGARYGS